MIQNKTMFQKVLQNFHFVIIKDSFIDSFTDTVLFTIIIYECCIFVFLIKNIIIQIKVIEYHIIRKREL